MRPGQSCPGVVTLAAPKSNTPSSRFNEAGAIMPRSGSAAGGSSVAAARASMRPGQSCPGVGKTGVNVCVATACFNEAGAIMPRSGPGARPVAPGVALASMRPGQSCPGVAQSIYGARESGIASMRPGQSCPGVGGAAGLQPQPGQPRFNEAGAIMPRSGARDSAPRDSVDRRFNEAGAIMPRSGSRRERPSERVSIPSFNEAGAIMPRSGTEGGGPQDERRLASMRPGQSCPGVASSPRRRARRQSSLQ